MLIRLFVACSVVVLFAAGFFIGNYSVESKDESDQQEKTSLPTIRLISANSKEVDVSVPQEVEIPQTQTVVSVADEVHIQKGDTNTPSLVSKLPASPAEVSSEENALFIANERLLKELEHQLLNVSRLRDRVADLEWETLNLQSELLNNEIKLANSEAKLEDTLAAQPTVYNITNVPVGGSVIAQPPVTSVDTPSIETLQEPSPPSQASTGSSFFGPAPDRYEDLINPGSAEPQNQVQDRSN